jgi:hypothetical protein
VSTCNTVREIIPSKQLPLNSVTNIRPPCFAATELHEHYYSNNIPEVSHFIKLSFSTDRCVMHFNWITHVGKNYFTYSMKRSHFQEACSCSACQYIPHLLWKVHCHIDKSSPLVPICWHMNPVQNQRPYFCKIHFNIILPSMPRSPKWCLSFMFYDNMLCAFLIYLSIYLVMSTNYAIFCSLLFLPSSQISIFLTLPYSQTPSVSCSLLGYDTMEFFRCLPTFQRK